MCTKIVEKFEIFIKETKSTDFYLTGGFSQSNYLRNCILENETLKNIIIRVSGSTDMVKCKNYLIR